MTHNPWKIYEGDDSFSVYLDGDPAEGFWFRNRTDAEKFRSTITDDQNLDPFVVFIYWPK
jgi:hypothetical protein